MNEIYIMRLLSPGLLNPVHRNQLTLKQPNDYFITSFFYGNDALYFKLHLDPLIATWMSCLVKKQF